MRWTFVFLMLAFAGKAGRGDPVPVTDGLQAVSILFVDGKFTPLLVAVPAAKPLTLAVTNAGRDRIEFESFKLRREAIVEPGQTVVIRLPALRPGVYDFYDDFHADVASGTITAR